MANRRGGRNLFRPRLRSHARTKRTSRRAVHQGRRHGPANKRAIVTLVERGGNLRSFHVAVADKETVDARSSRKTSRRRARLHTDESRLYWRSRSAFCLTIRRSSIRLGEYVRGDVHTNTIEGAFSIFKRGMKGIYQHCKEKHLAPLSGRVRFPLQPPRRAWISDIDRTMAAVKGVAGKRLTYRQPH